MFFKLRVILFVFEKVIWWCFLDIDDEVVDFRVEVKIFDKS